MTTKMETHAKPLEQSLGAVAEIKGDWSGELLDLTKALQHKDYSKHREQLMAERRRV